jgi:GTP-binding protein Era
VIVDTPGLHRPRTLLGQRLNDLVGSTLAEVDLIAFCSPANEAIGVGDKKIVGDIAQMRARKIAIVTKADTVSREKLAQHLMSVNEIYDWDEIIPVSALTGEQLAHLVDVLISKLPEGPMLYPDDIQTEETDEDRICELVREAALELVRDEMPHSLAVSLDEIVEGEQKPTFHMSLWVERDSQKGIVIGKGGSMLKTIGTKARVEVERLLGHPVHLAIQVRIAKDWQRDAKQMGKLGF